MIRSRSAACFVLLAPALALGAAPPPPGTPAAAPGPAGASATASIEDDAPEHPPIPPAKDTLGGHFLLGAGPVIAVPFGELDSRSDFGDRAAAGFGVGGDLGVGVSRSVALGGWVEYLKFGEASDCGGCDASSLAFGAFVRYHLVQGVRFDPWASIGAGYRMLDAKAGSSGSDTSYSGIDFLRLQVGGDWYALSQVGFGPYLELALGSFTDRPSGSDAAVYGTFLVGLRLAIDAQGK